MFRTFLPGSAVASGASPAVASDASPAAAFTAIRLRTVLFLIGTVCFSFVVFMAWQKQVLVAALLCVGAVFAFYNFFLPQKAVSPTESTEPEPPLRTKMYHTHPPPQPAAFCMRRPRLVKCFPALTPPLRDVRMDFPAAMSPEQVIKGFRRLGIYPQVEDIRDRLRQWCSSTLLKPLLNNIEGSHIQLMQKISKIGITCTISPVGRSDLHSTRTTVLPQDRKRGWQLAFTSDEERLLRELLQTLTHTIAANVSIESDLKTRVERRLKYLGGKHQKPRHLQTSRQQQALKQRQTARIANLQECVDSIIEYLKLQSPMKRFLEGEWAKGLDPCSSFTVDYTVKRVRELAEGSCVKSYAYDCRADSHLLLYLFFTSLEQSNWMEPSGLQTRGKCIAVVSGVPSTLQDNAIVLALDKQSPRFALYWDKKLQFTLQGITSLWDSMLLICHIIKVKYGGVAGGLNLQSYSLLRVFDD